MDEHLRFLKTSESILLPLQESYSMYKSKLISTDDFKRYNNILHFDMTAFTSNSNVTMEFIENNDANWNHTTLSLNPNLDTEYIIEHDNINWDHYYLSANLGLSVKDIKKLNINHDYGNMSYNPTLSWRDIEKEIDKPWNIVALANNLNVIKTGGYKFIQEILNPLSPLHRGYNRETINTLSGNPNLSLKIFLAHRDLPWNMYKFSKNPELTIENVLRERIPIDIEPYSTNENITPLVFEDHPEINWSRAGISANVNFSKLFGCRYIGSDWWNVHGLCENPGVTWETLIRFYPKSSLSFSGLSSNKNIPIEVVKKNLEDPWAYIALFRRFF